MNNFKVTFLFLLFSWRCLLWTRGPLVRLSSSRSCPGLLGSSSSSSRARVEKASARKKARHKTVLMLKDTKLSTAKLRNLALLEFDRWTLNHNRTRQALEITALVAVEKTGHWSKLTNTLITSQHFLEFFSVEILEDELSISHHLVKFSDFVAVSWFLCFRIFKLIPRRLSTSLSR